MAQKTDQIESIFCAKWCLISKRYWSADVLIRKWICWRFHAYRCNFFAFSLMMKSRSRIQSVADLLESQWPKRSFARTISSRFVSAPFVNQWCDCKYENWSQSFSSNSCGHYSIHKRIISRRLIMIIPLQIVSLRQKDKWKICQGAIEFCSWRGLKDVCLAEGRVAGGVITRGRG